MKNKRLIQQYYNSRAACQLLGCLIEKPALVKSKEQPINVEDFVNPLHQVLFGVLYDLSHKGLQTIRLADVETHLSTVSPLSYERFKNAQGEEWFNKLHLDAELSSYDHYYGVVKKLSCLRVYMEQGIDVTDLLDYQQIDPELLQQQEERFLLMSLNDIITYFDRKHMKAKHLFTTSQSEGGKLGDGAFELRERIKEKPAYGFSFESEYLNALGYGLRQGALYLESRDSGTGKETL